MTETSGAFVATASAGYCEAGAAALEKLKAQGIRTAKLLKSRRDQWASSLPPLAQRWAQRNDKAGRPGSRAVAIYMQQLRGNGVRLTRDWSRPAQQGAIEATQVVSPAKAVKQTVTR